MLVLNTSPLIIGHLSDLFMNPGVGGMRHLAQLKFGVGLVDYMTVNP